MSGKNVCPFCGNTELCELDFTRAKKSGAGCRRFMHCAGGCGGFFVPARYFLPPEAQKARYLLHDNNLFDPGYRSFLKKFADTAIERGSALLGRSPRTIFDYGCGNGALIALLKTYKQTALLPLQTELRGWDPFFAPDTPFFESGADMVLCLEVAEHFESPHKGFAGLARACKAGGVLALHTLFAPAGVEDFKRWWYKEDPTHVSFYTQKALRLCAERAGFTYCGTYNNCSIFRAAFPR